MPTARKAFNEFALKFELFAANLLEECCDELEAEHVLLNKGGDKARYFIGNVRPLDYALMHQMRHFVAGVWVDRYLNDSWYSVDLRLSATNLSDHAKVQDIVKWWFDVDTGTSRLVPAAVWKVLSLPVFLATTCFVAFPGILVTWILGRIMCYNTHCTVDSSRTKILHRIKSLRRLKVDSRSDHLIVKPGNFARTAWHVVVGVWGTGVVKYWTNTWLQVVFLMALVQVSKEEVEPDGDNFQASMANQRKDFATVFGFWEVLLYLYTIGTMLFLVETFGGLQEETLESQDSRDQGSGKRRVCACKCRTIRFGSKMQGPLHRIGEHFEDIWEKLDLLVIAFLLLYFAVNVMEAAGAIDPTANPSPEHPQVHASSPSCPPALPSCSALPHLLSPLVTNCGPGQLCTASVGDNPAFGAGVCVHHRVLPRSRAVPAAGRARPSADHHARDGLERHDLPRAISRHHPRLCQLLPHHLP